MNPSKYFKYFILSSVFILAQRAVAQFDQQQQQKPSGSQQGQESGSSTVANPLAQTPLNRETITNNDRRGAQSGSVCPYGEDRYGCFDSENQPNRDFGESTHYQAPPTPEPATEFQQFIADSTGKMLPIFGNTLFKNVPSTFAPLDKVPVTLDYVIGPGDEIQLRGWGQLDLNYRTIVDRNGNYFIPKVGNVNVAGVKFGELQPYIKSAIERIFHNFDLNVSLGHLRSIQVLVVGQVKRPGSYTVSSLSSLVNAIFASGGPSNKGSMRRIQLKRGDAVITEFDLYDLIVHGDKSKDKPLLPGDVIYFPPVGALVAITGSVNEPAIFELKKESTLGDLLKFAGGLTPSAAGIKATVERISERQIRRVDEFELDGAGLTRPLEDGDLVWVRSLSARFANAVTLRGNVENPGRFPWKDGMRVKDLVPSREFLITRDFWSSQDALVKNHYEVDQNGTANKTGPTPGSPVSEGASRLTNEIRRNAPEINWDYAVVQRLDKTTLSTQLLPFNLGLAINGDPKNNLELEAGDIVTIFSQADLRVPIAKQNKFVRLEGEFAAAGVYEVQPGETLKHLVERVGGISSSAYLFGSDFTRESTRIAQQKQWNEFLDQFEQDIERSASARSQNVVSPEDAAGLHQKVDSQRSLIGKLRLLQPTGRIVLGIKPYQNVISSLPDFVLEDGDRFIVPYEPAMVNVVGSVYNEASFLFKPNRTYSYYLTLAGGGKREADRGHAFVVRADGSILGKSHSSGWFSSSFSDTKMMPGDTIVVPEKVNQVGLLKGLKDWSQVLAQFALGAAALKTLSP